MPGCGWESVPSKKEMRGSDVGEGQARAFAPQRKLLYHRGPCSSVRFEGEQYARMFSADPKSCAIRQILGSPMPTPTAIGAIAEYEGAITRPP